MTWSPVVSFALLVASSSDMLDILSELLLQLFGETCLGRGRVSASDSLDELDLLYSWLIVRRGTSSVT